MSPVLRIRDDGYAYRVVGGRMKYEHIAIAERAIGKPLPPEAEVHHVDEDRGNNTPSNLVICPDRTYHRLLHARARALDTCGNANWRKCQFCKVYDAPESLFIGPGPTPGSLGKVYHPSCAAAYVLARYTPKSERTAPC